MKGIPVSEGEATAYLHSMLQILGGNLSDNESYLGFIDDNGNFTFYRVSKGIINLDCTEIEFRDIIIDYESKQSLNINIFLEELLCCLLTQTYWNQGNPQLKYTDGLCKILISMKLMGFSIEDLIPSRWRNGGKDYFAKSVISLFCSMTDDEKISIVYSNIEKVANYAKDNGVFDKYRV